MIVILGPTRTGKTNLAIRLAKKYEYSIISTDSRQVYKYMDYGTGKMPIEEKCDINKNDGNWIINGVKIYGYDIKNPDEVFSAYEFKEYYEKIQNLCDRLIMVGGTGFYIDAALGKINFTDVKPDEDLRKNLEKSRTNELANLLIEINPEKAATMDLKNRNRLMRAIEISISKKNTNRASLYNKIQDIKYVGLTSERNVLYENSDKWVEKVFPYLIEETSMLSSKGYRNTDPLKSFIYNQTVKYLDGLADKEESMQKIKYDMHHYIRRQMTWFKRNKEINWYDIKDIDKEQKLENLIELK